MSEARSQAEWTEPKVYKIDNEAEVQEFVRYADIKHVIDPIDHIADDMFELRNPSAMDNDAARAVFVQEVVAEGPSYGGWVHYPWMNAFVHIASPEDHYDMRTYRNRNLITKDQQTALHFTRIAAFGLSVGSNVVDRTIQSGIGSEYLLFDYDRLSPANLNRIQASVAEVGLLKTTIAGRKMAELDPYVQQQHHITGYDRNTDDILRANRPDIIIEEVDNLEVKARLRHIAKELKVPLVMAGDVGDKSTLDIERHDTEEVAPFNGKLTAEQAEMLRTGAFTSLPSEQKLPILIQMLGGMENISPELYASEQLKGIELAGTPQLGTTAAVGGALTSVAIRDIFLGRDVKSSANVVDATEIVGTNRL